jgi:hypothetical protein
MMRIAKIAEDEGGGEDSGARSTGSAEAAGAGAAGEGSLRVRGSGVPDIGRGAAETGFG